MPHGPLNRLSRPELRKLEDFIFERKQAIEDGKWTAPSIATFITKQWGRPVTEGNIHGAASTMGVKFKSRKGAGGGCGCTNKELQAAVRQLAHELCQAKKEFGLTCSPTLLLLCGESNGTEEA